MLVPSNPGGWAMGLPDLNFTRRANSDCKVSIIQSPGQNSSKNAPNGAKMLKRGKEVKEVQREKQTF